MKTINLILLFLFITHTLSAQNFLEPVYSFSKKKMTIITLTDGKVIEATYNSVDRKKGLLESITIKDKNGKKKKIVASEIDNMYIPESGWNNAAAALSKSTDATSWSKNSSLNEEYIKDGYAYFEQVNVIVKKKERVLLMQLLNPGYCNKIKVFHDPYASESGGMSVGGMKVSGGDSKSYYVKTGENIAYLLKKKSYDDEFPKLFGNCEAFMKKYGKKPKWKDFEEMAYEFSTTCD